MSEEGEVVRSEKWGCFNCKSVNNFHVPHCRNCKQPKSNWIHSMICDGISYITRLCFTPEHKQALTITKFSPIPTITAMLPLPNSTESFITLAEEAILFFHTSLQIFLQRRYAKKIANDSEKLNEYIHEMFARVIFNYTTGQYYYPSDPLEDEKSTRNKKYTERLIAESESNLSQSRGSQASLSSVQFRGSQASLNSSPMVPSARITAPALAASGEPSTKRSSFQNSLDEFAQATLIRIGHVNHNKIDEDVESGLLPTAGLTSGSRPEPLLVPVPPRQPTTPKAREAAKSRMHHYDHTLEVDPDRSSLEQNSPSQGDRILSSSPESHLGPLKRDTYLNSPFEGVENDVTKISDTEDLSNSFQPSKALTQSKPPVRARDSSPKPVQRTNKELPVVGNKQMLPSPVKMPSDQGRVLRVGTRGGGKPSTSHEGSPTAASPRGAGGQRANSQAANMQPYRSTEAYADGSSGRSVVPNRNLDSIRKGKRNGIPYSEDGMEIDSKPRHSNNMGDEYNDEGLSSQDNDSEHMTAVLEKFSKFKARFLEHSTRGEMSYNQFAKLLTETTIYNNKFRSSDAPVIFSKAQTKVAGLGAPTSTKITFDAFLEVAVLNIAKMRGESVETVVTTLLGPKTAIEKQKPLFIKVAAEAMAEDARQKQAREFELDKLRTSAHPLSARYVEYSTEGKMHHTQFLKLLRDTAIFTKTFCEGDAQIVFDRAQVKAAGVLPAPKATKLTFNAFVESAVPDIAKRRGMSIDAVMTILAGPKVDQGKDVPLFQRVAVEAEAEKMRKEKAHESAIQRVKASGHPLSARFLEYSIKGEMSSTQYMALLRDTGVSDRSLDAGHALLVFSNAQAKIPGFTPATKLNFEIFSKEIVPDIARRREESVEKIVARLTGPKVEVQTIETPAYVLAAQEVEAEEARKKQAYVHALMNARNPKVPVFPKKSSPRKELSIFEVPDDLLDSEQRLIRDKFSRFHTRFLEYSTKGEMSLAQFMALLRDTGVSDRSLDAGHAQLVFSNAQAKIPGFTASTKLNFDTFVDFVVMDIARRRGQTVDDIVAKISGPKVSAQNQAPPAYVLAAQEVEAGEIRRREAIYNSLKNPRNPPVPVFPKKPPVKDDHTNDLIAELFGDGTDDDPQHVELRDKFMQFHARFLEYSTDGEMSPNQFMKLLRETAIYNDKFRSNDSAVILSKAQHKAAGAGAPMSTKVNIDTFVEVILPEIALRRGDDVETVVTILTGPKVDPLSGMAVGKFSAVREKRAMAAAANKDSDDESLSWMSPTSPKKSPRDAPTDPLHARFLEYSTKGEMSSTQFLTLLRETAICDKSFDAGHAQLVFNNAQTKIAGSQSTQSTKINFKVFSDDVVSDLARRRGESKETIVAKLTGLKVKVQTAEVPFYVQAAREVEEKERLRLKKPSKNPPVPKFPKKASQENVNVEPQPTSPRRRGGNNSSPKKTAPIEYTKLVRALEDILHTKKGMVSRTETDTSIQSDEEDSRIGHNDDFGHNVKSYFDMLSPRGARH